MQHTCKKRAEEHDDQNNKDKDISQVSLKITRVIGKQVRLLLSLVVPSQTEKGRQLRHS